MKKISLLCLALALLLSGCQLAKETIQTTDDRLVGVFLTKTHLDLFDMEAYLNDNLQHWNGGMVEGDTKEYQGRRYAELVEKTLTNEQGETTTIWEYEFQELEGIPFFTAKIERDGEAYNSTSNDSAIIDGHSDYKYGDNLEEVHLTASIYMKHNGAQQICYVNPVYQSADGRVYLTSGNGIANNPDGAPGVIYGTTMSQTTEQNVNGEKTVYDFSIALSFSSILEPFGYRMIQMDADSRIVADTTYTRQQLPDELTLDSHAAYAILETTSLAADGSEAVERELLSRDQETMQTLSCHEDGYLMEKITILHWIGEKNN